LALPLIAGYAYHKKSYTARTGKKFAEILDCVAVTA
jgi:deoxyhypusine synthase